MASGLTTLISDDQFALQRSIRLNRGNEKLFVRSFSLLFSLSKASNREPKRWVPRSGLELKASLPLQSTTFETKESVATSPYWFLRFHDIGTSERRGGIGVKAGCGRVGPSESVDERREEQHAEGF